LSLQIRGSVINLASTEPLVPVFRSLTLDDTVEAEDARERPKSTFHNFLQLPAELRMTAIHEYLILEREAGRLSGHCHHDAFGNRCCVWEYPNLLIAYDNQEPNTFPLLETARAPIGW
jgi:hypothetical protein